MNTYLSSNYGTESSLTASLSNQNNNNNNNVNEGIDVLLNEFENNVNIMGTGVPMMGRKLLRGPEGGDTGDSSPHTGTGVVNILFDEMRVEIIKYFTSSKQSH